MPVRSSSRKNLRRKGQNSLIGMLFLSFSIVAAAVIVRRNSAGVEAVASQPVIVGQYDMVTLPVPVEPVAAGTKVSDIRFRNVNFPAHQVPEGAVSSLDIIADSVTTAPLPANLPLFRKNLSNVPQGSNAVVDKIPAGMRAMTIRVDATSSVEGWAGSGSIVDVLLVEKDRTTVVAELVRVLSAERSVSPVEGASTPNVPSTVTLLVTQEQCLAINTAIPLGKIAFALRSRGDMEKWENTRFTSDSLKGGSVITNGKGVITGVVSSKGSGSSKAYALSDGKWIETTIVPEGFFVGDKGGSGEGQDAAN